MAAILGVTTIALFVGAARSARASCGDYVVIGNPSASQTSERAMTADNVVFDHDESPGPVNRPCHGPSCRGVPRPLAAPVAPVPQPERASESWARLGDDALRVERTLGRMPTRDGDLFATLPGWYPAPWRPPKSI